MTLRPIAGDAINQAIVQAVFVLLDERLAEARPGHCLRISHLSESVMLDLCRKLNAGSLNADNADIVYLLGPWQKPQWPWQVSATQLIELRNAEARPLLVFVPPGVRTAAEDSFDVSTFVDLELTTVPHSVRTSLRTGLTENIQSLTDHTIRYLTEIERMVSDDDVIRYYLTILQNELSPETAGAAIYQLGLIPDFHLYSIPDQIKQRLSRNIDVLRKLLENADPLLGRIHQIKLQRNTIQLELYNYLREQNLIDVSAWGQAIACEPKMRHLAYDCWQFEGEVQDRQHILIYIDDLELPARDPNGPVGADNPRYLDVKKASNVRVKWSTNPKPATVDELAYFRIEIVSTDEAIPGTSSGAITWESKNITVGKSKLETRSHTLKVSDFREQVEDGLYFFRVRAYSANGDILNEEDSEAHPEILRNPQNLQSKRFNESEDVWFWVDPAGEPPPVDSIRNVTVESFLDAQTFVRLAAIDRGDDPFSDSVAPQDSRTGWASAKKGKRAEATYHIVFDAQMRFTITVSSLLRQIESDTLRQPENLGRWRVNFVLESDTQGAEPTPTIRAYTNPERIPSAFLQARAVLFQAIRGSDQIDKLTATIDLLALSNLVQDYAQAYLDWLQETHDDFESQMLRKDGDRIRTDPLMLDLDVVEVLLPSASGGRDRIYLLAPAHPLRLLWHLQLAQLAKAWLQTAIETGLATRLLTDKIRLLLRRGINPANLPPVLRSSHESYPESVPHFYVEQAALNPFWTVYLREDVKDSRTLIARLCTALRVAFHSSYADDAHSPMLTRSFLRYLLQHPYVHLLKINLFNPGDATILVEAILGVERARMKAKLPSLRYELHLFTYSQRVDEVGSAVEELLNPERQVSAEADAFAVASLNPRYPKLHFSKNSIDAFLAEPKAYEAHLSILYDLFPVEVSPKTLIPGRSSFVHGLIQEQIAHFDGDAEFYAWQRQLVPAACTELPNDRQSTSEQIAKMLVGMSELQASVSAGKLTAAVPTLQLRLSIEQKALLFQIHEVSDWVFTIDRHLGLDYFDSETSDDRPIYLLDFRPEFAPDEASRLLLTTRSIDEIRRLVRPALQAHDLLVTEDTEVYFLRLLRSLSGRLALKLLSAPSQISEALGLALARLLLEQYDLLQDRVIIPLDAHTEWFAPGNNSGLSQDELSLRRGDLMLVSCNPDNRTLQIQIIEVKFQSALGSMSAYLTLRQDIEQQLINSEETLRRHFDPQITAIDRLDRQFKTKELITLLQFYLGRSLRYGLTAPDKAAGLRQFFNSLDDGYQLTCSSIGLIFDLSYQGIDVDEEHAGLIFYRVGRDLVERLLNNGLRRRVLLQEKLSEASISIEEAQQQEDIKQQIIRDTTLKTDPSYTRVRTHFGTQTPAHIKDNPANHRLPDRLSSQQSQLKSTNPMIDMTTSVSTEDRPVTIIILPNVQDEAIGSGISRATKQDTEDAIAEQPISPTSTAGIGSSVVEHGSTVSSQTEKDGEAAISYDVLLGDTSNSKQFGLLGLAAGKRVALDLNGTNTISLFGVQGGGKSYTVGTIVEMATQQMQGVNRLPAPLASVIFHYHESQDYAPEFVSMNKPNTRFDEVTALQQEYGALPVGLADIVILTSAEKLEERQAEFPGMRIEPIAFNSSELSFKDWRFLMGVAGNQMYLKQINMIMRQLRQQLTIDSLRNEIMSSGLTDQQKTIARIRLDFAGQFIDDSRQLSDLLRPGRLLIVDLRDEFIDKDEALGLFVVMLNIFANAGRNEVYNKLIVFDEAHKYMDNPELTSHIVDVIRQMRHQGVSVLIASQDPPSLPSAIIELSSLVILHRFNSPQWLKHVQRSITALADLTPAQLASLRAGDAYVWSTKATEKVFTQKSVRMRFRPRVTQHGGATRTALEG